MVLIEVNVDSTETLDRSSLVSWSPYRTLDSVLTLLNVTGHDGHDAVAGARGPSWPKPLRPSDQVGQDMFSDMMLVY